MISMAAALARQAVPGMWTAAQGITMAARKDERVVDEGLTSKHKKGGEGLGTQACIVVQMVRHGYCIQGQ
jgi:hypothetical protein